MELNYIYYNHDSCKHLMNENIIIFDFFTICYALLSCSLFVSLIPVHAFGVSIQVYVLKRPYVDEFLKRLGELFECVLFTASLSKVRLPEYQM